MTVMKISIVLSGILAISMASSAQGPRSRAANPGNIFVQGQDVRLPLPASAGGEWQAADIAGHTVASGKADGGEADLGALPVGYYTVSTGGAEPVSVAVIAPLRAPTPADSPISIGIPSEVWTPNPVRWKQTAQILKLVGVNWGRNAIIWSALEPERGELDPNHEFEEYLKTMSSNGLKLLSYVQQGPQWSGAEEKRFPTDLREVFRFYREMASKWQAYLGAVEPWNEPNARNSGAEIASYQKAAYLGLKAGNPSILVCSSSLMRSTTPEVLRDFVANDVSSYFDVFDFHHYTQIQQLSEVYKDFRPLASGKPIWVTEFNDPVFVSPESRQQDPSAADMQLQMDRLPKLYAATLYHGVQQAFYFLLLNHVESAKNYGAPDAQVQFGLLRADFTPRPAFLALAAVGRLLAGAHSIGKFEGGGITAFAFQAEPDGKPSDVLVAWSDHGTSSLNLKGPISAAYDVMGRPINLASVRDLKITSSPVFVVLPAGTAARQELGSFTPSQPLSSESSQRGSASPVVLQAAFTGEQLERGPGNHNFSADRIEARSHRPLQIFVYNFSDHQVQVSLQIKAPSGWLSSAPNGSLSVGPYDRVAVPLNLTPGMSFLGSAKNITVRASGPGVGNSVLSFNVVP